MRRRKGFTFVELIVSIGIIIILMSLLLPVVSRIRANAMGIKCQANIRSIMIGCLAFAMDHEGHFPGTWVNYVGGNTDTLPEHSDWLYGPNFNNIAFAPQTGTIFPYMSNNLSVYRCPITETMTGYAVQSNGRFDYAVFGVWNGATIGSIKQTSLMTYPDGHTATLPTPMVCQEAAADINWGSNGDEGLHNNVDLLSTIHLGGSYIGAVDGSGYFVVESKSTLNGTPGAWVWSTVAPSGKTISLGSGGYGVTWDWFARQ